MTYDKFKVKMDSLTFQEIADAGILTAINEGIGFSQGSRFGLSPIFERITKKAAGGLSTVRDVVEPETQTIYRITIAALDAWSEGIHILSNSQREMLIPLVYSLLCMNNGVEVDV